MDPPPYKQRKIEPNTISRDLVKLSMRASDYRLAFVTKFECGEFPCALFIIMLFVLQY